MPRVVAFLRGINVGGHRVRMETLREAFVEMGFDNVGTFIASGNVIFDAPRVAPAFIERRIEAHLAATLGYEAPAFLRSASALREVIAHEAFPPDEVATAHALHVVFLKQALSDDAATALSAMQTPMDAFHVRGREVYWLCRCRLADSLVPASAFGRVLGRQATTMRNITMLKKLVATM